MKKSQYLMTCNKWITIMQERSMSYRIVWKHALLLQNLPYILLSICFLLFFCFHLRLFHIWISILLLLFVIFVPRTAYIFHIHLQVVSFKYRKDTTITMKHKGKPLISKEILNIFHYMKLFIFIILLIAANIKG